MTCLSCGHDRAAPRLHAQPEPHAAASGDFRVSTARHSGWRLSSGHLGSGGSLGLRGEAGTRAHYGRLFMVTELGLPLACSPTEPLFSMPPISSRLKIFKIVQVFRGTFTNAKALMPNRFMQLDYACVPLLPHQCYRRKSIAPDTAQRLVYSKNAACSDHG